MYYFYLNDTQLPIPPKALTINYSNKNETLDLLSVGEVTIPKPMGLTNYSFEILLPNSKYPSFLSLPFSADAPLKLKCLLAQNTRSRDLKHIISLII